MARPALWLGLVLCVLSPRASAQSTRPWTLDEVIAAARGAPDVRLARARAAEATAYVGAADTSALDNPSLEALLGPRLGDPRSTDLEVGLSWPIPLGGVRGKRVAVARANASQAALLVAEATRQTVGAAAAAYFRALHAEARRTLVTARVTLARELLESAAFRQRAGDVAGFEVRLVEGELGRAEARAARADAEVAAARGALALALGLPGLGDEPLSGSLDAARFAALGGRPIDQRPDVAAARAERTAAAAAVTLADSGRLPGLALRLSYALEDDTHVLLGGLEVSLPLFQRAQGPRREARARRLRAEVGVVVAAQRAASETSVTRQSFDRALAAARALSDDTLRRSADNEALAGEAYRAGKIDLTTLILLRRDGLELREEALDRALDAALAGVDLWVALGTPPLRSQP